MVSKVEKAAKEFESRSKSIHGDIFDYSKVEYKKSCVPVNLGCKVCGNWFNLKPNTHFSKPQGCPFCSKTRRINNSRKSVEDFITDSVAVHGNKYDYSNVDYKNSHTKVKITCLVHGEFEQTPSAHLTGKGCAKCSNDKTGERCRATLQDFLEQSFAAHGNRYDYSLVNYTNMHVKVKIICREHGEFLQKPNHHYTGVGCPVCGKIETANKLNRGVDKFVELAKEIHGDLYTYDKVIYKNSATKVIVTCPIHGDWHTSPANHLIGSGCPACGMKKTGFDNDKLATLYVMSYADITKVGITNRPINKRLREIVSDSQRPFTLIKAYTELEGGLCFSLESSILKTLKQTYSGMTESFCGSTECFVGVDNAWLLNTIEQELREKKYNYSHN